jgi:hypothetical protein
VLLRFELFSHSDLQLTLLFCRFEIAEYRRVNPHAAGLH